MKNGRSRHQEIAVIDLFAGAGGFAVAAERAGGHVRLSVEIDETCCATLDANPRGSRHLVECADVGEITGTHLRKAAKISVSAPLIVVGGPPCQPFSKASYWTDPGADSRYRRARARGEEAIRPAQITKAKRDDRRELLSEFRRLVLESHADGFVMENVGSLLHPRNKTMFNRLVGSFEQAGYPAVVRPLSICWWSAVVNKEPPLNSSDTGASISAFPVYPTTVTRICLGRSQWRGRNTVRSPCKEDRLIPHLRTQY